MPQYYALNFITGCKYSITNENIVATLKFILPGAFIENLEYAFKMPIKSNINSGNPIKKYKSIQVLCVYCTFAIEYFKFFNAY